MTDHRTLTKKQKRPFPFTAAILLMTASLLLVLLFYTWCRVQCVQMGYQTSAMEKQYQENKILHKSLKVEIVRLNSPERIERIGKEQFGLVPPDPKQIAVLP